MPSGVALPWLVIVLVAAEDEDELKRACFLGLKIPLAVPVVSEISLKTNRQEPTRLPINTALPVGL